MRKRMKEAKRVTLTTLLFTMALLFSAITNINLKVNAAETIPDGAYNPDTYVPTDYVIPHGISDNKNTGYDYLNSLLESKIFCCGDTITCTDTDMSVVAPTGEYKYCIVADSDHELQALVDMGIVEVAYSEYPLSETDSRHTIKTITFRDPTKLVKLAFGNAGGQGDDPNGHGAFNSITVLSVISTSLKIDYQYYKATGVSETSGYADEAELLWYGNKDKLAATLYPVIEEGKSYNIETPLPVIKGSSPSIASVNGYKLDSEISSDLYKVTMNVPAWIVDYYYNYDEDSSDYYDNHVLKTQSDGKYKLPVIDKVLLSFSYSSYRTSDGKYTLTFHGNEGTVDGYDEYTLYVPDSLYENGEIDVVMNNGQPGTDYYNLTYNKLAGLVGTPKRDGYEFVRWCQKDNGEQDDYYRFRGLNRTELQPGYWQSDYYWATTNYAGFNVDLYAVWNHTAHTWDNGTGKDATYTEEGEKTYTCTVCGETKTEKLPKLVCTDHKWDAGTGKDATYTEEGEKTYTCTVCGETKTEKLPKLVCTDHKWNAGEVTKAATAAEDGIMTYTCSVCHTTKTEAIPKTGSTTGGDVTEAKAPEIGTTEADSTGTATYEVAETSKDSSGSTVVEVTYVAPTAAEKKKTTVIIPDTVTLADGTVAEVTEIAADAFKNNKKITNVKVGKNVEKIGKNAFSGCTKLKTANLGSRVISIGDNAFAKCTALTKITIPASTTSIGKAAFNGDKKLKTITIKSKKLTTKTVSKNAFKGVSSKTTIQVPKTKKKEYTALFRKKGLSKKVKIK